MGKKKKKGGNENHTANVTLITSIIGLITAIIDLIYNLIMKLLE